MTTPTAAAIYARISSDTEGTGKGVERQVEDCRKLAAELGWPVYDEYVDNDISAYSGKHRPAYERMLDDIREATVDAVLVYNFDRLTRRPIEFEQFNLILQDAGVSNVRFVASDVQLGSSDGLFEGRIRSAMAASESAKISERVRRKNDQLAAEGRPHGGTHRPFGFEDDRITHRPAEVAVIRTMLARFLAEESVLSITAWLNEQDIRQVKGSEWKSNVVTRLLISPRIAGLRQHRGEIVGPGVWEPIVTLQERDKVLALLEQRRVSGRRSPRKYLLSGLLRCGKCEDVLYSQVRGTRRRYVCQSGPDHGGCGGISVTAEPLERLIASAVLLRLDTPELLDAMSGPDRADIDTTPLMEAISADREQLEELATAYAQKSIPMTVCVIAESRVL